MAIRTRTLPRENKGNNDVTFVLLRHIVGIARELLTIPEREPYFKPEILSERLDACGYKVYTVRACNARDVSRFTDGTTIAGRQIVHTHIGKNLWEITTEDL